MSTAAFIIISYFYKGFSFVCIRGHTRSVYGVSDADFETDAGHEKLRAHVSQGTKSKRPRVNVRPAMTTDDFFIYFL